MLKRIGLMLMFINIVVAVNAQSSSTTIDGVFIVVNRDNNSSSTVLENRNNYSVVIEVQRLEGDALRRIIRLDARNTNNSEISLSYAYRIVSVRIGN
jgi:P pilus assembly chaperone PapD